MNVTAHKKTIRVRCDGQEKPTVGRRDRGLTEVVG